MAKAETPVPTSSVTPDQVQVNQNLTTLLNDIEALMAKTVNLANGNSQFEGVGNHLRRARDDAASQIGLVKDKQGNWGQA